MFNFIRNTHAFFTGNMNISKIICILDSFTIKKIQVYCCLVTDSYRNIMLTSSALFQKEKGIQIILSSTNKFIHQFSFTGTLRSDFINFNMKVRQDSRIKVTYLQFSSIMDECILFVSFMYCGIYVKWLLLKNILKMWLQCFGFAAFWDEEIKNINNRL